MIEFNRKQLEILNIAERLFAKKGFSGTSIRDISHEADINVSMVSYYFGSKEKMIQALFELRGEESRKTFEQLLDSDLKPIEKVDSMIKIIVNRIFEKRCFYNIMTRELLSSDTSNPVICEVLHDIKLRNLVSMNRLISEGQQKGDFRKNIDEVLLFNSLFGTIHQTFNTKTFYLKVRQLESLSECDLDNKIREDLCNHLKLIFRGYLLIEK